MKVTLQPRDQSILKYVFKFRVATYEQLRSRFFKECSLVTANQRIRELCRAGYLKPHSILIDQKPQKYVEGTPFGWKEIRHVFGYDMDRPHYKSESPLHDLRFSNVAKKFEGLKTFVELLPENLLQSSTALSESDKFRDLSEFESDGALTLKASDGRQYLYAIEYELSKKSPERYREKLAAYYTNRQIQGVLYVCSKQELIDSLTRVDDGFRTQKKSILYSALESDVLRSENKIRFQGSENTSIEFF